MFGVQIIIEDLAVEGLVQEALLLVGVAEIEFGQIYLEDGVHGCVESPFFLGLIHYINLKKSYLI